MHERRWPWLVASASLVAAGLTGAAATYLWWLPCRGAMLVGTILEPARNGPDQACIDRMGEGTPFPLPTEVASSTPGLLLLATVTMILVAVAWLLPVFSEQTSVVRRVIAAFPALAVLAVAVLGLGIAYGVPGAEGLAYPLDALVNLLVLAAVVVLWGHSVTRARYLVAALALSAMGFAGPVIEYLVMVHWSELNWDAPPGSGYLTAGLLVLCGLTLLTMSRLAGSSRAPCAPSPKVPPSEAASGPPSTSVVGSASRVRAAPGPAGTSRSRTWPARWRGTAAPHR
jgi:hypothetical protein